MTTFAQRIARSDFTFLDDVSHREELVDTAQDFGGSAGERNAQLKRAAISHMRRLSKLPDSVRSFFGHKTFRYAA